MQQIDQKTLLMSIQGRQKRPEQPKTRPQHQPRRQPMPGCYMYYCDCMEPEYID
jgi:hypothetical protein